MIKVKPDATFVSARGKEFASQRPEWLDNSGYSSYSRCPAKFFFSSVLGLRTGGKKAPLEYGTAVHEAMPFLQRGLLVEGMEAFKKYWQSAIDSGVMEDDNRNLNNAYKMLKHWYQEKIMTGAITYEIIEPPEGSLKTSDGYSDQEFAFCVDLSSGTPCKKCSGAGLWVDLLSPTNDGEFIPSECPSCNGSGIQHSLPFAGRVDGLARNKDNGKIWLVEYKTAAMFGGTFAASFDLNSQPYGYATALKVLYPHLEIQGCYIEALRTSKTNPACMTIPLFYHDNLIEVFIESFNEVSSQILESYRTGRWDQNLSACAPYAQFGTHGYQCPYASMCKAENWQSYLDAFVVNRWKPFDELSGEGSQDG